MLHSLALAQEPSVIVSIPVSATPTPSATIDYTLPYPGILPDNPLYTLKVMRDNIIGWLIADPLKKAQFDILQADKRLESGVYLLQESRNNAELALSTISKGENYMNDALARVQEAGSERRDISAAVAQLRTATRKHLQVLNGLSQHSPSLQKRGLESLEQRVNRFIRQADALQLHT